MCTRLPARYTRPSRPGVDTVVVPAGLPPSTEPWNCAPPAIRAVVAFGKFHSSFGPRSVTGSPGLPEPVLVLTSASSASRLTITVAPAGMPLNTRSAACAVVPMESVTVKTCRALVPSPVKVTVGPAVATVPVAVAAPAHFDRSAMVVRSDAYLSPAAASWICCPGGVSTTLPDVVPR